MRHLYLLAAPKNNALILNNPLEQHEIFNISPEIRNLHALVFKYGLHFISRLVEIVKISLFASMILLFFSRSNYNSPKFFNYHLRGTARNPFELDVSEEKYMFYNDSVYTKVMFFAQINI